MSSQPALPYCTVKGFRRALDALRASPAQVVDRAALLERGLSPHAVYPVLGALRFLGLIGEDGAVRPALEAFLSPADVDGRRRAVELAYAGVLEDLQLPVDEREEVDRLLVERHGCAPGVAAFCSTFLLWMLAESGRPVARPERARRGRPPAYLASLSEAAQTQIAAAAGTGDALPEAFGAGEEVAERPASVAAGETDGSSDELSASR